MNNKKGVSDIVVTVLLVLLALAAIAMVWAFISGYIGNAKSKIAQSQACMDLDLVPVSCTLPATGANANVTYRLGGSATGLKEVRILVEKQDGSVAPQVGAPVPAALETKIFTTNVLKANAKRFSIVGVITVDDKDVFCTESGKVDCK